MSVSSQIDCVVSAAAHDHAVDRVIGQLVEPDQRAVVIRKLCERIGQPSAASPVGHHVIVQGVDVDVDRRSAVVLDDVVHDDRLGADYVNHGRGAGLAAVAVAAAAARVVLQGAVGDPHVGLIDFDRVPGIFRTAFDRALAAGILQDHVVQAGAVAGPKYKPAQSPGLGVWLALFVVANVPPAP